VASPTYQDICSGTRGYVEVIQIQFDDTVITHIKLLTIFSACMMQLNRQCRDIGTQHRSYIFYHDLQQKQLVEEFVNTLEQEKVFAYSIKTTIEKLA
jgi:peptide-methionine (S)-S-oxide reductase